jgi:putative transcriptional regulator
MKDRQDHLAEGAVTAPTDRDRFDQGRCANPEISRAGIVNRTLTRLSDDSSPEGSNMQRLRLKADGRIVELRDGQEFPLAPVMPAATSAEMALPAVRDLRRRARLTQTEFAAKLGVPVETIRNWEQGKRAPRGPARALLAVFAHAPDTVFAALAVEPAAV